MRTLAEPCSYEEVIKKSRFIANAASVRTPEDTFAFLEKVKAADATHNCWVFRIGGNYRFSDDGEPKGTAGKPMFGALERMDLDRVMVVVTRFFGGVKLGAGGLTRAYGGVTTACLKAARITEILPMVRGEFVVGFDGIGQVYTVMKQHDVEKCDEEYTDQGVLVKVRLLESKMPEFSKSLADLSRGAINLVVTERED